MLHTVSESGMTTWALFCLQNNGKRSGLLQYVHPGLSMSKWSHISLCTSGISPLLGYAGYILERLTCAGGNVGKSGHFFTVGGLALRCRLFGRWLASKLP